MSTPTITLAEAHAQLAQWLAALEAASLGASYSIGGRSLTRQDVDTVIRPEIQRWTNTIAALEAHARGEQPRLGSTAAFPAPGAGAAGLYSYDAWRSGQT